MLHHVHRGRPNRKSPPAILLRESYREGGDFKRAPCNLSDWPRALIEGLRGVLKGGTVIPLGGDPAPSAQPAPRPRRRRVRRRPQGRARPCAWPRRRSLSRPHPCPDPRSVPRSASKLATARALKPDTAASIGELLGLGMVGRRSSTALDWLLEHQPAIEATLARRHLTTARWCFTMSHPATWKGAAARSASVATAATARRARCRSSTACSAPRTAARLRSRCSRATPATR